MLTRKAKNQLTNIEDRQSKYNVYLEAKITAERVLEAKTERDVTVVAPVQSGKTAIMVELIKEDMLRNLPKGKETLYIYTCLLPRTTVTMQTEERFVEALGKDDDTLEPTYIRVLMPSELSKITHKGSSVDVRNYDEIVLILDEVHTHSRDKGVGESVRKLINKGVNLSIIYVTATPGVHGIVKNTTIVKAVIPLKYRGVENLDIRELPSSAFCGEKSVLEPETELEQDVLNLKPNESIVVRATGKRLGELAWLYKIYGGLVDIYQVDSENDWVHLDKLMNGTNKKNGKGNVFILKQGLTAGNTITNKKHIVSVYETVNANDAGVVQGLVGRMCGYDEVHPDLKVYCNTVSVEKYLGFYDGKLEAMSTPGNKETVSIDRYKQKRVWLHRVVKEYKADVSYRANYGDNKESQKDIKKLITSIKSGTEKINRDGDSFYFRKELYKVGKHNGTAMLSINGEDRLLREVQELEIYLGEKGIRIPEQGGYFIDSVYVEEGKGSFKGENLIKKGTFIPVVRA